MPDVSDAWLNLEAEIVSCRRCPRLVAWREEVARIKRRAYRAETYWGRPVPGFGDRAARLLIVGLAPGAHGANRTGRMFTGDSSGDFLYAALYRAGFASQPTSRVRDDGLTLRDAFISAACRCAPPDNKPTAEELAACLPFLAREIGLLPNVRVVVALGRIAFEALLRVYRPAAPAPMAEPGPKTRRVPGTSEVPGTCQSSLTVATRSAWASGLDAPAFAHGTSAALGPGLPLLIASYHPSRQNTQTGRLTVEMFDAVWAQLRSYLSIENSSQVP